MAELKNDLLAAMGNPDAVLYSDEFLVIIADKYPKSKHHYLVMPKENIQEIRSLKTHHIPKLIYMELKGLEYVMRKTKLSARNFQVGFHAFPSMNRLHLHVLSKDFMGPCLKLTHHWNSFHTEFFVPTHKVIAELQTKGMVILPPNKKCLHQSLRCHICDFFSNDIQNIKLHLSLFHSDLLNNF